jgi:hypothetical protein
MIYHTTRLLGNPNFNEFNTRIRGFESAIYGSDDLNMSASYMDPSGTEYLLD